MPLLFQDNFGCEYFIYAFMCLNFQATRLNWYRDSTEWKPFHHDAAAIKGMRCGF